MRFASFCTWACKALSWMQRVLKAMRLLKRTAAIILKHLHQAHPAFGTAFQLQLIKACHQSEEKSFPNRQSLHTATRTSFKACIIFKGPPRLLSPEYQLIFCRLQGGSITHYFGTSTAGRRSATSFWAKTPKILGMSLKRQVWRLGTRATQMSKPWNPEEHMINPPCKHPNQVRKAPQQPSTPPQQRPPPAASSSSRKPSWAIRRPQRRQASAAAKLGAARGGEVPVKGGGSKGGGVGWTNQLGCFGFGLVWLAFAFLAKIALWVPSAGAWIGEAFPLNHCSFSAWLLC